MDCGSLFSCLMKLHLRGQSLARGWEASTLNKSLTGQGFSQAQGELGRARGIPQTA